ncbi:MAG: trigger factor, partial [Rhodobacteraceae bacterium]|nr:trigger factor [Paracoccaceae bacterium]
MQVTQTLNEGLKKGYAITVPAAELEAKVSEKLEEARKDFQMKGFRKGKAPAALMKKMFGKSVLGEAMQESIDAAMREHFEATGDRPALQPEVKMTNEAWAEGQDVEVSMVYEALPEVPELDFAEMRLEKLVAEIDEAAVREGLENLAKSASDFEERKKGSKAKDGDQVVIDFTGTIDGEAFEGGAAEDFPLVLGAGSFIPGFEDKLVGAKAGDAPEVTVTFPDDYGAAHLAGKAAVFAVTVKAVKAPKPAPVDDALAERYGAADLAALTEQIRTRLAAEYAGATRAILKRRLMDALDERLSFELPPSLVEVEAKQIAHQLWHEEHADHPGHDHPEVEPTDEHKRLAERRVRLGLLLADVGNRNVITVSDQEMQRAVIAQARRYPGQERQFVEFMQKNAGAVQQLRAPLFEEKVVDYILALAQVAET